MLAVSKQGMIRNLRKFFVAAKWVLVILNTFLFYITFHHAAYIALSEGKYMIYISSRFWIYQSQWSFLVACGIAAAVFLGVAWRSMGAPISVLQLISLATAPIAFFVAFGGLVHAMF